MRIIAKPMSQHASPLTSNEHACNRLHLLLLSLCSRKLPVKLSLKYDDDSDATGTSANALRHAQNMKKRPCAAPVNDVCVGHETAP